MCDITFENAKGCSGTVNRTSVYSEAVAQKVLYKHATRNFAEFTSKHLCMNLYFDKVKPSRPAISFKASL